MSGHAEQSPFDRALGASLRQRAAQSSTLPHGAAAEALSQKPNPLKADAQGSTIWRQRLTQSFNKGWARLVVKIDDRRRAQREKRLRVVETVALGEKRFVAIVAVEQAQFLVGHGPGGVSLLARLEGESASFGAVAHSQSGFSRADREMIREAW